MPEATAAAAPASSSSIQSSASPDILVNCAADGDGGKSYALTGKPETCRPIIRIDLDPTRRPRRQGVPGRVDNNRRGPKDTRPGALRGRADGEPEAATGRRRPVTKAGIVSAGRPQMTPSGNDDGGLIK